MTQSCPEPPQRAHDYVDCLSSHSVTAFYPQNDNSVLSVYPISHPECERGQRVGDEWSKGCDQLRPAISLFDVCVVDFTFFVLLKKNLIDSSLIPKELLHSKSHMGRRS